MDEKQKILVVDDEKFNINVLTDILKNDYKMMVAKDGEHALKAANSENKPDLILLDIMMPDMNGYEVCTKLKADDYTKDIPVIFITAITDEDGIEKAYDVGGVDYITKPIKPKEVMARVKSQLQIRSLINHLDYISSYDQLTKIHNRRKFFELAENYYNNTNDEVYGVMADIDKFKSVNDTYGHPVGDIVLSTVANEIKNLLPKETYFGRLGGEEFAIIYKGLAKSVVDENLEAIRQNLANTKIPIGEGKTLTVTISIGVGDKQSNDTLDDILKSADEALYDAKESGRNRVIFRS